MKPLFKQSIDPAKSLIIVDEYGNSVQLTVENFLKAISQLNFTDLTVDDLNATTITTTGNGVIGGDLFVQGTTVSEWDSTAKQTVYNLLPNGLVSRYNIQCVSKQQETLPTPISFNPAEIPVGALIIGIAIYIDEAVDFSAPTTLNIEFTGGYTNSILSGLTGIEGETATALVEGPDKTRVSGAVNVEFIPSSGTINGGVVTVAVYYEVIPGIEA